MTMDQPFPLNVAPAAVAQMKRILTKDGRTEAFIRVGVKGGGCSGLEYVLKLDTVVKPIDLERQFDEVRVVCDAKSAPYLEGASIEYTGNLIGGGFKFENPNADRSCGCGTSFMPKPRANSGA